MALCSWISAAAEWLTVITRSARRAAAAKPAGVEPAAVPREGLGKQCRRHVVDGHDQGTRPRGGPRPRERAPGRRRPGRPRGASSDGHPKVFQPSYRAARGRGSRTGANPRARRPPPRPTARRRRSRRGMPGGESGPPGRLGTPTAVVSPASPCTGPRRPVAGTGAARR